MKLALVLLVAGLAIAPAVLVALPTASANTCVDSNCTVEFGPCNRLWIRNTPTIFCVPNPILP